jgi:hypothetical protein
VTRRSNVINPGGKGPRVWCGRCKGWVWTQQRPWPKAGYVAKPHQHDAGKMG